MGTTTSLYNRHRYAKLFKRTYAVPVIIGLNILVFFVWWFFKNSTNYEFMTQHFLVSWDALLAGREWTLITSVFSHNLFLHIFLNMYVLNSFGTIIEHILGFKKFVGFYFIAGIMSSIAHSAVSAFFLNQPELPALGASGSVAGLVILFSFMFPKEKILILGIIPLPAIFGAIVFIGLDIWGLLAQIKGGGLPIGHGAHIGGSLTGIFYYVFILRAKMRNDKIARSI